MSILKNRTALGVICIALSLLICFAVTPLFNRSLTQTAEIVRMAKDVAAGEQITDAMVQSVEVGSYNLPETVVTDRKDVVGKYAASDLYAGDYLLPARLSDEPAAENEYLYRLDGTRQALSVTIRSFALGLSGKLKSGDIVSVLAPDYEGGGRAAVPAELQYVEVIGVTASSGYDANTDVKSDRDEKELPSTVTLLVTPAQAGLLAELEADGSVHLSLVYRGERENAAKFIKAQDEALAQAAADSEVPDA